MNVVGEEGWWSECVRWNVGVINDDLRRLGFAGSKVHEAQRNSMVFGTQSYGRGSVIFFTVVSVCKTRQARLLKM